jgi:hypothetical protein
VSKKYATALLLGPGTRDCTMDTVPVAERIPASEGPGAASALPGAATLVATVGVAEETIGEAPADDDGD